jgi:DNA topoisomerase-2
MSSRQVEKLLSERDEKEAELITLLKLTPVDIWNTDLDNFVAEWRVRNPTSVEGSLRI